VSWRGAGVYVRVAGRAHVSCVAVRVGGCSEPPPSSVASAPPAAASFATCSSDGTLRVWSVARTPEPQQQGQRAGGGRSVYDHRLLSVVYARPAEQVGAPAALPSVRASILREGMRE
jgi:hypothetical protein